LHISYIRHIHVDIYAHAQIIHRTTHPDQDVWAPDVWAPGFEQAETLA